MRQIFYFFLILLLSVPTWGGGAPEKANTADLLNQGETVYKKNCVLCHGEKGLGDGPASKAMPKDKAPRNLVSGKFTKGDSYTEVFETVSKGIPGSLMPAWGGEGQLSESEREAVVRYILSLRK